MEDTFAEKKSGRVLFTVGLKGGIAARPLTGLFWRKEPYNVLHFFWKEEWSNPISKFVVGLESGIAARPHRGLF